MTPRTRFAPSPTGDLHLGGAWTALASWALARAGGGATVLRVEDIDTPRVVHGAAERIAFDLAWLGLDWDEGPYAQSGRTALYEAALAKLAAAGLTYPCDCSRAEIARVASAPHAGEELVYPGTCRDADPARRMKRDPAIRLRVPDAAVIAFDDRVRGHVEQRVDTAVGDFVLRRGDGIFAYQLVVAIDDAEARITDVVRADDLLGSTARQILLMQMLGYTDIPAYAHVPLVVAPDGERLAKRTSAATVRELRERGVPPENVIGELAFGLGLVREHRAMTARDVAANLAPPGDMANQAVANPASFRPIAPPPYPSFPQPARGARHAMLIHVTQSPETRACLFFPPASPRTRCVTWIRTVRGGRAGRGALPPVRERIRRRLRRR